MFCKLLRTVVKFLVGIGLSFILFSLIIKNPIALNLFSKNGYIVHIYASITFILSGVFAIDFKTIKSDIKQIYKSCNDFDEAIFSKFKKRPNK